ncbi:hypothetical protein P0D73_22680 [Paraburkholderia sp. RL18-101-BIB-B]|uniref:hypothetical protein n=1 Tax=unclassified Paraburkholderia TaxID=2615204 RepID=UPI0038BB99D4
MNAMTRWTLNWPHGEATIQALGGMLGPVRFELGGGQSISPLHVAPWGDDARWPGLMRALRGEWPCLPFGTVHCPSGLSQGFEPLNSSDDWNHGYGSNHLWQLVEQTSDMLRLRIDYPENGEIESLERVIKANPDAPILDVSLTVRVRREVVLPVAHHPTFAVPLEGVEILGCPHQAIHSYPAPVEPGVSKVLPDRTATSLSALPTGTGSLDVTLLPLTVATEEILQIAGCQPPFVLRYAASGADVLLDWNVEELPDALLWISNGGRTNAPWCGRNFALGVEPANSFFDLGRVVVPPASHPLAARSGLRFLVEEPRTIRYRLSVQAI